MTEGLEPDVALAGDKGETVEDLLRAAMRHGALVLADVCRIAFARLLRHGPRPQRLFNVPELARLADAIAAVNGTAQLTGRAMVRQWQRQAEAQAPVREDLDGPLAVPVCRQDTNYSCGAAALQAVLAFHGLPEREAKLAQALGTNPAGGTRPADILVLARQLDLPVEERENLSLEDLEHCLAQGVPVLCPVQMHGGGHWVVVTGLAKDTGRGVNAVHLMDPVLGAVQAPAHQFEAAWHDRDADGKPFERYGIAIGAPVSAAPGETRLLAEALGDIPLLTPEAAVQYFTGLVPQLGVDPMRFGLDLRRSAFTLAVATDQELLGNVQDLIAEVLRSGVGTSDAPSMIDELLNRAGVSPANPQYAEMVFRTNAMDSYNTGAVQEMQDPDVAETFPVWKYSNPDDSRSRKTHAERNGWYYPNAVSFFEVRGTGPADACNCRCNPIPISKYQWARLVAAGARIADGYPDVPATAATREVRETREPHPYRARLAAAAKETDRNPTDDQKKAGNYRKGKVTLHGLPITIENPRGGARSGTAADGSAWSVRMAHHYGYVRKTESDADGDHVDVFIGPHPESELVFVIDQVKADGAFDEHKCMLGFITEDEARKGYLACYTAGWKVGPITAMTMPQFKEWLASGDTGKPLREVKDAAGHDHASDGKFTSGGGAATKSGEKRVASDEKKTDSPLATGHSPLAKAGRAAVVKEALAGIKDKGIQVKDVAARVGKAAWERMPPKLQKFATVGYQVGHYVLHQAEGAIRAGKATALEVARERGGSEEHVARVGTILGIADNVLAWTVNMPATLALTGSVGAAKASSFVPVASMAYLTVSFARNPIKTVQAARRAIKTLPAGVKDSLLMRHAHEALDGDEGRELAGLLLDRLQKAGDRADWYEALVYAALDETQDLGKAIKAADAAFAASPRDVAGEKE